MTIYDGAANPSTDYATLDATSNTLPSPQVCSSQDSNVTYPPWRAFNRVAGDSWMPSTVGLTPVSLMVDLGAGNEVIINKYAVSVSYFSGTTADFKDWILQGSNDVACAAADAKNANGWTDLDTRTSGALGTVASPVYLTFSNDTAYRYYRIRVTDTVGGITTYRPATDELKLVAQVIPDAIETNTSSDEVGEGVLVSNMLSEVSSSSDTVVVALSDDFADVEESTGSTEVVDGYQDYCDCDVAEGSESTSSDTIIVLVVDDVLDASTSSDEVTIANVVLGDVAEEVSAVDYWSVVNVSVDDISGTFSLDSNNLEFTAFGHVGTTGTLVVAAEAATIITDGLVDAVGELIISTAVPLFTGAGICDIRGEIVVETAAASCEILGAVDAIGELVCLSSSFILAASGASGSTGELAVTTTVSRVVIEGHTSIFGSIDCASKLPDFECSGLVASGGRLSVTISAATFGAAGAVGCTGLLNVTPSSLSFFGSSTSTEAITYCVNLLQKGLISTFLNYHFTSFATINGTLLGSNASGFYKLIGDLDNSTAIPAKITFPLSKLGVQNVKQVRAVRIFGRADDNLTITITDGKAGVWETLLVAEAEYLAESLLGYFPFTTRGRYIQVEVENLNGGNFFLDQLNVELFVLGRA